MDYGAEYSTAGDDRVIYRPLRRIAGRRMVVLSHGRGATPQQFLPDGSSAEPGGAYRVAKELCDRGYIVVGWTFGTETHYGSPAAHAQANANFAALAAAEGVLTDKIAWLAYSMGFTLASSWSRANAGKTAALVGIAPLTDIDEWMGRGEPAVSEVNAAFNTWASAGGDDFDPINHHGQIAAVPKQVWAGLQDPTILPGDVAGGIERYALASGAEYRPIAGNHGTLWFNVDPIAVADFIDAGDW